MLIPHIAGPDADIAESPFTVTAWALSPNIAARRARSLLRSQVIDNIIDQSVLDDLGLMVSELATNAAVHANGPYEMRLLRHAGVPMVCEIADTGGGLDVIAGHLRREPEQILNIDTLQMGGRGLAVVANLSGGRCGAHTTRLCSTGQPGKSVWFAVPGSASRCQ
jgi:anti-sigma regulatory factor (Ser/Thr protein kinase)